MLNTEQWLNSFITKQAGNSVQDDMTLPILVDLYNQGYDRVEWVGSDRCIAEDDTDEICHRYDSDKTTWTLRDFLCITSGFNFGIPKKAYKRTWLEKDWSTLTDEQKADVLRTPTNAFNYACSLDNVLSAVKKLGANPIEIADAMYALGVPINVLFQSEFVKGNVNFLERIGMNADEICAFLQAKKDVTAWGY